MSAGTTDDGNLSYVESCTTNIDTVNVEWQEIFTAISKLKLNSTPGPDNLPSYLYKNLKYSITKPL